MSRTTRRVFLLSLAAAGPVPAATPPAAASAAAKLDEKDPQAAALGYVADTTKAGARKFANHRNEQKCGGCQLFQGMAGEALGACPIFAGRQVAATGWCTSWIKKAG